MARFRILSHLVEECPLPSDLIVVCFLHIREDLKPFIAALVDCGISQKSIFLSGPPYSFHEEAGRSLQKTGIGCYFPPLESGDNATLDEGILASLLEDVMSHEDLGSSKVLIVEDGGHIVPMIHDKREFESLLSVAGGAVEQTTRGITLDRRRELEIPVASVPDCYLKRIVEPRYVGPAIRRNLEEILNLNDDALQGKRVGIIGFGGIGSKFFESIRHECTVHVTEIVETKSLDAILSGAHVAEDNPDLARKCNILVGTTGETRITKNVIDSCKDRTYLASASSRQIEIDVAYLENTALQYSEGEYLTEFTMPDGRLLYLVYDGYPVNFALSFSLPKPIVDMVYSLIYSSAHTLVVTDLENGVHPCLADEEEVARLYKKYYLS